MHTKDKVMGEKKCGIKYFDKAQALVGQVQVIQKAISISNQYPDIWQAGWSNFHWAFYNAVSDIIQNQKNIMQTYNLDEVLNEQEIAFIKQRRGYNDNFTCLYTRKTLKRVIKKHI